MGLYREKIKRKLLFRVCTAETWPATVKAASAVHMALHAPLSRPVVTNLCRKCVVQACPTRKACQKSSSCKPGDSVKSLCGGRTAQASYKPSVLIQIHSHMLSIAGILSLNGALRCSQQATATADATNSRAQTGYQDPRCSVSDPAEGVQLSRFEPTKTLIPDVHMLECMNRSAASHSSRLSCVAKAPIVATPASKDLKLRGGIQRSGICWQLQMRQQQQQQEQQAAAEAAAAAAAAAAAPPPPPPQLPRNHRIT